MSIRTLKLTAFAFLAIGGWLGLVPSAVVAAPADYRFEIVAQPVKAGREASFALQAVHIATGKPVAGLAIKESKLHMDMGTMDMASAVKLGAVDEKGLAHFSGALTMYGEWTLDIAATLPEEKEPIRASVKFQVVK